MDTIEERPTNWKQREAEESRKIFLELAEAAKNQKGQEEFVKMVESLDDMTDAQKVFWIALAAKDYFDRLQQAVDWAMAYRNALSKRFAQDAHKGCAWKHIPLSRREEIHMGMADGFKVDYNAFIQELSGWPKILQKHFVEYVPDDSYKD